MLHVPGVFYNRGMDDRETRVAVLKLIAEERERKRHRDGLCLRGKQCPIQRPMLDRWSKL